MKLPRRWLFLALSILLLVSLGLARAAFAAEGAEQNPAAAPMGSLFRWLNFLLVLGGAGYWIARRAPNYFRSRAGAISASIAEAAAAQAKAEQQLRQAEDRLTGLDREVAALRAAAQRESAAEAERIRAAARDEAERIARAARAEIEAAERASRVELKAVAARAAVERADALIRKQVTAVTQSSLFRSFLDNLARSAQ